MNKNNDVVDNHHDNEEVTPVGEPVSPEIEPIDSTTNDAQDVNDTDKISAELADTKDRFLRLYSEFDNFRKRTQKERLDLLKSASSDMIISLLPVLDDFERALKFAATNDNSQREGVELIYTKLKSILELKGLKRMISVGEEFNVDHHEAITNIPSPTPDMKGKVVDEAECGYFLNEKVIRHAKVIVGN